MINLLASAEVWNWNYGPKGKTPLISGGSAHSAAASFGIQGSDGGSSSLPWVRVTHSHRLVIVLV